MKTNVVGGCTYVQVAVGCNDNGFFLFFIIWDLPLLKDNESRLKFSRLRTPTHCIRKEYYYCDVEEEESTYNCSSLKNKIDNSI